MKTFMYAIIVAASPAMPALAQNAAPTQRGLSVAYADLDLRSDAGIRALDQRIRNAASAACGIPSPSNAYGRRLVKECRAEARDRALAQRSHAIATANRLVPTSLAAAE